MSTKLEQSVVDAALDCPDECIFIETQATDDRQPSDTDEPASPTPMVVQAVIDEG